MGRLRAILETAATVAFIAVAASAIWVIFSDRGTLRPAAPAQLPQIVRRSPDPPLPTVPLSLEGAALRGSATAKVVFLEFTDLKCPYCGRFARETLPGLQQRYVDTGKVLLALRQFPLPIHAEAEKAAEAAECAGRQGKFWQMHDNLFNSQERLDEPSLHVRAKALGLDAKAFDACLGGQTVDKVQQDLAAGKTLSVSGTPAFFIGALQADGKVKLTQRLSGALPAAQFEAALEKALATAR